MKDQNAIQDKETTAEKWERARAIFLESVHKPDHQLRGCAHNQKCYHELLEIREQVIGHVKSLDNPHVKLKPGEKNNLPDVKSTNGISVTLLGGALGKHYMKDWKEEHLNEWEEYLSSYS